MALTGGTPPKCTSRFNRVQNNPRHQHRTLNRKKAAYVRDVSGKTSRELSAEVKNERFDPGSR
jgi:hypothetical protein